MKDDFNSMKHILVRIYNINQFFDLILFIFIVILKEDYEEGKMLTASTTVNRLFDLIEKDKFESGETIDYFDDK